jgi:NAD(P)H-flavin reductase
VTRQVPALWLAHPWCCLAGQQVTQQLAAGVLLPVRATGPIGRTTDRTLHHPVLLIFAGGVGVSPCMI